ncbi:Rho termination factor N-terminal domain-containing protein [Actinophytocola sp.]
MDASASKRQLYDVARKLDIRGRSSMTEQELVDSIEKADTRRAAQARR